MNWGQSYKKLDYLILLFDGEADAKIGNNTHLFSGCIGRMWQSHFLRIRNFLFNLFDFPDKIRYIY